MFSKKDKAQLAIDRRASFNIGGLVAVIIAIGVGVVFIPTIQTATNSLVSGTGHPLNGSAATLASNLTVIYAIALVMGVAGYIVYAAKSM